MSGTFKNFADVDAICPFYVGLDSTGRTLRCEPLIEHSMQISTFRSARRCADHMRRYCHSFNCEKCRLYRALDAKYGAPASRNRSAPGAGV